MRRVLLAACLCVFFAACRSEKDKNRVLAQESNEDFETTLTLSQQELDSYRQAVDSFLNSSLLKSGFNGSILIAKGGNIIYERYEGYKDLDLKDTLTRDTPLQIASTTKTFTATAILKLIQEGKVGLNDSLQVYFPGFPYKDITVKMLLNHRSGLPNYLYFFDHTDWDKKVYLTNQDVLNALFKWQPPRSYKPNTRFQYCNTNYVLLALIIEKISNQTYPDYMQENFFEPLKMNNTFVFTLADTLKSALSYNAYGGLWTMDFTDGTYGDKNIYSTPRDLLKWDQALYAHRLVGKELMDSAFTPYSFETPSTHNYGLGWRILQFENGKRVVYHNGRWHGFNSALSRLTDEKVTIIILGNKYKSSIYTIARKLYSFFGNYDEGGSQTIQENMNKE